MNMMPRSDCAIGRHCQITSMCMYSVCLYDFKFLVFGVYFDISCVWSVSDDTYIVSFTFSNDDYSFF